MKWIKKTWKLNQSSTYSAKVSFRELKFAEDFVEHSLGVWKVRAALQKKIWIWMGEYFEYTQESYILNVSLLLWVNVIIADRDMFGNLPKDMDTTRGLIGVSTYLYITHEGQVIEAGNSQHSTTSADGLRISLMVDFFAGSCASLNPAQVF